MISSDLILSRFESFRVHTVMTAGLLDGVNPCAFAAIVFLVSFLALAGYRRREMFLIGTIFTLAVFIAYLLIGLGIFGILKAIKGVGYITVGINIAAGVLAFILGILNLADYIRFKKTKDPTSFLLKLPLSLKNRVRLTIGSDLRGEKGRKKGIIRITWAAFAAGFIAALLESLCTGQIYLPVIVFVLKMPGKSIRAFLYLLVYNIAFIIPLATVFLLGFFGITSKAFSGFMKKRIGIVKLSTAALFFMLSAVLLILK